LVLAVNIALIGCGAIGTRRHLSDLKLNPKAKLAICCDVVQSRAEAAVENYGSGTAYTSYEKAIAQPDIDAVIIATPNYLHAPMTIASLRAGKHVLVEKPLATTREDARAMIRAASESGKFLMVGQSQRLDPSHQKAREIIASGRLGKPLTFRTAFKHRGPEKWCIDDSLDTWFFKKNQAVLGVCGDLAIHKVDLMRYLLGEEFADVSAIIGTRDKRYADGKLIEVDDNAMLMVRTTSGVMGSIIVSWTNYGEWEANYTVIYCEKGVIMMALDPKFGVVVRYQDGTEECYKTGASSTNEKQVRSFVSDVFVDSILANKEPSISGLEGFRSLDVVIAAFESSASGKRITLNDSSHAS
jgi:UDP-N-acetylglucosamine 3-dehydrogenase